MRLATPQSAILSAVIFNALIIVALIPLALRGVKYVPQGAAVLLRRNLLVYGLGGVIVPFIGIKLIDLLIVRAGLGVEAIMKKNLITAVLMTLVTTVLFGLLFPLLITGLAQVLFPKQANGELLTRNGKVVGSRLIGQSFSSPGYFHSRPSSAGTGYDAGNSGGSNLGPTNQSLIARVQGDADRLQAENPGGCNSDGSVDDVGFGA